jgi:hypothetical protein
MTLRVKSAHELVQNGIETFGVVHKKRMACVVKDFQSRTNNQLLCRVILIAVVSRDDQRRLVEVDTSTSRARRDLDGKQIH